MAPHSRDSPAPMTEARAAGHRRVLPCVSPEYCAFLRELKWHPLGRECAQFQSVVYVIENAAVGLFVRCGRDLLIVRLIRLPTLFVNVIDSPVDSSLSPLKQFQHFRVLEFILKC